MFYKPLQIVRLWNGDLDIIENVDKLVDEYDEENTESVEILFCRNGIWTENDVAQIEGELK